MDRGAWQATVHVATKNQTLLRNTQIYKETLVIEIEWSSFSIHKMSETFSLSFWLVSPKTQYSDRCVYVLSHVQLFATPWAVACQAPLSMEFSKQEYWSGLPFPTPGDFPTQ